MKHLKTVFILTLSLFFGVSIISGKAQSTQPTTQTQNNPQGITTKEDKNTGQNQSKEGKKHHNKTTTGKKTKKKIKKDTKKFGHDVEKSFKDVGGEMEKGFTGKRTIK
ncbi:hypothetical protein A7K93_04835 [Candidatus Methylacidiphilum fumarolicum]|uniref:Uncharacterized protein n=2 Tax=Candidatus Methylacidiphilum fumarolicum TaxID=591154 RepID=I0JZH0_METFB|nr:hypothetical protein [Candidatus Methylacidiphilum fumarolicum]MBW6415424.1 hypothetical protein [Candidatus Methylacidiphilum fumarolicum]TFE69036.1 hypothetical protein A7K73_07035 [Candidatus Methylacidiphilum fumarolicum]TFE74025.1 hypothetical protein A7K93_04835 [Candidatus Methylacidiphilum fumarolicum]TFE74133.1 hypothetical protein A7D33_01985 [Candidatus Methylacidiphilum fumarolicum]TFE74949.1 hypothetical protein A7K72_02965 [Candidatus Methylacidiphilum fumarolicum]